jgi:uncharacterized protein
MSTADSTQPPSRSRFADDAPATTESFQLPLFPLGLVLFPGGLLPLKIFEARYLDLMSRCLRDGSGFGVVALREGAEAGSRKGPTLFERVGVIATLMSVDSPQPGILFVQARGGRRFRMSSFHQAEDSLWWCDAQRLPVETPEPPAERHEAAVEGLRRAIQVLAEQGAEPFEQPHRLDDAGWVAHRWAELLPVSLAAKQRLMEMDSPLERLDRVWALLQEAAQRRG